MMRAIAYILTSYESTNLNGAFLNDAILEYRTTQ